MIPDDQDYSQDDEQQQDQGGDDRYSPQNPSGNQENGGRNKNQQGKQKKKGLGDKAKQAIKEKIDPRERIKQLRNPAKILKRAQKDLFKNMAKNAVKAGARSPWFWIIIIIIAIIIFLILIITGVDEEENQDCLSASGSGSVVASGSATASSSGSTNQSPDEEPAHDYKRTTFGGKPVNQRTKIMLENAEKIGKVKFTITQGSYNPGGVAASGGTHDGGGVVDISETSDAHVKALRMAGFAAWRRGPPFPPHIHAVAIGDKELAKGAAAQVGNYFNGLDGLSGNAKDNAPASVGRPFPKWAKAYANGAQPLGGSGELGESGDCVCTDSGGGGSVSGSGWEGVVKNGEQYGAKWKEFLEAAKKVAEEEDYPIAVIVAQGALESTRGTSPFAKTRNNFFGINAVDANPNNASSFDSVEEGVKAYVKLIKTEERYKAAYAARNNPKKMVEEIKKAGYATDPDYVNKVTNIPEFKALSGLGSTGGACAGSGGSGESTDVPNEKWDKVAACESTGNWQANTGNGFYGGLQFTHQTWKAFGGSTENAHEASKEEQIKVAEKVLAGQGKGAWPNCGKDLE